MEILNIYFILGKRCIILLRNRVWSPTRRYEQCSGMCISVKMADAESPWLLWFSVEWYRHCTVHSSLCMGSEGTETVRNGFLPRDIPVCYIPGVAMFIGYWAWQSADGASLEVSWKVVRIRRKWRAHTTYCPPHAILFPYFDQFSLLSPLLDTPRFRHFSIWKQKMQCHDANSSHVL